ncbi:hypothetical protein BN871_AL_00070 [Paenibacillus sp. P22]|nr:hypothetical protein BN871_AL_00070 [Paenibacillus sp. P22]
MQGVCFVFGDRPLSSQPLFLAEQEQHAAAQHKHEAHDEVEAVIEMLSRQMGEVHAVDAGNERQRHEDRRQRREHAHDLVGAAGQAGLVSLAQVRHEVAVRIKRLGDLDRILVDVAEVLLQLVVDQAQILFVQRGDDVALRAEHLLEPENFAAQADDLAEMRFFRMHENVFLEALDARLDPVADEEVIVHDKVDEMVQEAVGTVDVLLPQNRLQGTQLVDLLLRDGDDVMPAEKHVERPEEDLLVIEPDAVDNDKIMAFVQLDLRALLLLAQTVLDGQVVEAEQRLEDGKILDVRVDPVEALKGRRKRCLQIFDGGEHPVVDHADFHGLFSSRGRTSRSRMPQPLAAGGEEPAGQEDQRPRKAGSDLSSSWCWVCCSLLEAGVGPSPSMAFHSLFPSGQYESLV